MWVDAQQTGIVITSQSSGPFLILEKEFDRHRGGERQAAITSPVGVDTHHPDFVNSHLGQSCLEDESVDRR